jgi:RecB family endonuclease NucS
MKILLRDQDTKKWEPIDSVNYSAEHELQKLLAETPSLIPISEIRENSSPLVAAVREIGLPGSGSTDILAFNPEGDIVVVECKLSANTEIKRKVIAQLLEYGAYLRGMSYEDLDGLVLHRTGQNLAELVGQAASDPSWDENEFRNCIQEKLNQGGFILIIAVDEMNEELTRTIRFLNECGKPNFAFTSLEMRRFQKETTEILVPHLFELMKTSRSPVSGKRTQWTEAKFFETVDEKLSADSVKMIQDIYHWSKVKADRIWFGIGEETGSFTFHYLKNGKTVSVFSVYTSGRLSLNYGWLSQAINDENMKWLHQGIISIPTFQAIPADFKRWPSVQIEQTFVTRPDDLSQFKAIIDDLGKRVHKS